MEKPSTKEQGGFLLIIPKAAVITIQINAKIVPKENYSRQFSYAAKLFYTINPDKPQ